MVKQTKTFKKGNVTKKALSAILAASMVMTSSSFVMAAPVEVEDVAVEAAAVDVVEDVDAGEESVGEIITNVTVDDVTYTGSIVEPKIVVKNAAGEELTKGKDYTVAYTDAAKKAVTVKDAGDYIAKITITKPEDAATGTIEKAFKVNPFEIKAAKVNYTESGYFYNGTVQTPTPTVTVAGAPSTFNADAPLEVVAYSDAYDMKSAGEQKIKLQLKKDVKNYTLTGETGVYSYIIDKASSFAGTVSVTAVEMVYTGSALTPDVVVTETVGGVDTVVDASAYDVKITDSSNKEVVPTNVGTYNITVTTNGTGNYQAGITKKGTFKVVNASLATAVKEATINGTVKNAAGKFETVYNGKEQKFIPADITIPGLTKDVDYTVTEDSVSVTDAGATATFNIKGINKYNSATAKLEIVVTRKALNTTDYVIEAKASKGATTIKEIMLSIKDGETELEATKDYTVDSIDTTKKVVVVKGAGNYTTEKDGADKGIEIPYTVSEKILINDETKVTIDPVADQKFTGAQVTPVVVVKKKSDSKPLTKGTDYTVVYGENVNTGEGTITITGMGDYEGTKVVEFKIVAANADHTISTKYSLAPMSDVTLDEAKAGKGQATPKLVYKANGASAPAGVTYKVEYFDAKGNDITSAEAFTAYVAGLDEKKLPATITVKATGTGAYDGEVTRTYNIIKGDAAFTVDAIADQDYTGKAIEPAVVVKKGSTTLTKGVDYTVTYENNVKVGTAYVSVKGIGKYTGTQVVAFNIVGEMDQTIEVLAAQERDLGNGTRTLNSKATKVKYTTAPETDVTYTSSDENVVTVDAEGNIKYTGIGEATITIEAKAENGYKAAKKEVKVVVTLAKPSFTPFSRNNAFTLTSSTVRGAEKFEVEYATKKDFSNSKTTTFETTSAGKVRQVKVSAADKKTYYVRVRAISGTTKSAWSRVTTVATK